MPFDYVIEHQNVTGLLSYELRDYIKELNDKNRREGLTIEEMEWLDEAVREREMRKRCKAYHPKKDEEKYINRVIKPTDGDREEGIRIVIKKYATFEDDEGNDDFEDWYFKRENLDGIRNTVNIIEENDLEVVDDVIEWCKTAEENEIYYLRNGEIEVVYIP